MIICLIYGCWSSLMVSSSESVLLMQVQLQAAEHARQQAEGRHAQLTEQLHAVEQQLAQLQGAHAAAQQQAAAAEEEASEKLAAAEHRLASLEGKVAGAQQQSQALQAALDEERQRSALERTESGAQKAAAAGELEQRVAEAVEEAQTRCSTLHCI